MVKYKLEKSNVYNYNIITKNGHTMFPEDVIKDLEKLDYLESIIKDMGGTPVFEEMLSEFSKEVGK